MAMNKMTKTSKPEKPKYVKLEKGERKAVRQGGVRKAAKEGKISEIYSAESGGRLVTSKMLSQPGMVDKKGRVNKAALSIYERPESNKVFKLEKKGSDRNLQGAGRSTKIKQTYVEGGNLTGDASKFEKQNIQAKDMNQAAFEKTRLGSRLKNRAEVASQKKGQGRATRYTATLKTKKK